MPSDGESTIRDKAAFARGARAVARIGIVLLTALSLGGCLAGQPGPLAASGPGGTTLAFETVDGPPPAVFDRLVRTLSNEAQTRNLAIVSREGQAYYRVRAYLSAQVRRGQATIAWVWDVYDPNQQRALRLAGEESAGKSGRDAWDAANDQVLARIAQAGMNGIAGLLNGSTAPAPAETPAPAGRGGPAVAAADTPPPTALAALLPR